MIDQFVLITAQYQYNTPCVSMRFMRFLRVCFFSTQSTVNLSDDVTSQRLSCDLWLLLSLVISLGGSSRVFMFKEDMLVCSCSSIRLRVKMRAPSSGDWGNDKQNSLVLLLPHVLQKQFIFVHLYSCWISLKHIDVKTDWTLQVSREPDWPRTEHPDTLVYMLMCSFQP